MDIPAEAEMIELRMTHEEMRVLTQAVTGNTMVADFMLSSALKAACQVLAGQTIYILNDRDC